jgi:hypothetical protein
MSYLDGSRETSILVIACPVIVNETNKNSKDYAGEAITLFLMI